MSNIIFNALAFKDGFDTSGQIKNKNKYIETYLMNSFVSLVSAKNNNRECDVILFVNRELPEKYMSLFTQNNIKIVEIEFNTFVLPKSFSWSLAFFKLEAFKYATNKLNYDNYLLLDTDTFVVNKLDDLWKEAKDALLLFDLDHRLSNHDRRDIYINAQKIGSVDKDINQFGGEFIAGNRLDCQEFIRIVELYFNNMISEDNLSSLLGDEFLISIAAEKMKNKINRANKYIYRYWTKMFYLVSTNYLFNAVDIWHLPQEKELTMKWLFKYYIKHKKFPSIKKCAKKIGFPRPRPSIKKIINIGINKLISKK